MTSLLSPWELCQDVTYEHKSSNAPVYPMTEVAVGFAELLYADAVHFCDQGGFPYDSIRVRAASSPNEQTWDMTAYKPHWKRSWITQLIYTGTEWKAKQSSVVPYHPEIRFWGEALLFLPVRPDRKIKSHKFPKKEAYAISVSGFNWQWSGHLGFFVYDPWHPSLSQRRRESLSYISDQDGNDALWIAKAERKRCHV